MTTRIRHRETPTPDGCRWCGTPRGNHGKRWVESAKLHKWTPPADEQRASPA